MASFDKEKTIFEWMCGVKQNKVCLLTQSKSEENVYLSFRQSNNWIDNSQDTNTPPDYYNDEDGYMLDFMRTNDYEERKKSGKVINPIATKENQMMRELRNSGLLNCFPQDVNIYCLPEYTAKPSMEKYFNNAIEVLKLHNSKAERYRNNFPGHKLIFCVCDLSEHEHKMIYHKTKTIFTYHPCFNRYILEEIKKLDIDFIIWYKPYIMPNTDTPQIVIIDVKQLKPSIFPYI